MNEPLKGVRILAVEQYGAGPFGTQHLADLGAEVIKLENHVTGGDYARALGPHWLGGEQGSDRSLFFQSFNRNKQSLCVDLSRPEGQTVLHRLIRSVDAITNNLRGDVPAKLGITYEALAPHNPAIVCGHCSAYGREGPRHNWPGYDYLMQAEAGYLHLTGEPDSAPTRMGLSIVDYMGGSYLALLVVSGVMKARATGIGGDLDVSLFDTALFNLNYMATWAMNADFEPERVPRSAHPTMVPTQLYTTSDGWIFTMINKPNFWPVFCELLGEPDLAADPRFETLPLRLENRDELTRVLDGIFTRKTTEAWLEILRGHVPVAPVLTPRAALETDFVAGPGSGRIETLETPEGPPYRLVASPFRGAARAESTPCAPLGANTADQMRIAGFTDDEIAELIADGVVAQNG